MVAHVGGTAISRTELDRAVQHFANEAAAEGRAFPVPGSSSYRAAQRQVLGLLVYRAELAQEGRRLGVRVTDAQVQQRLQTSASTDEEDSSSSSGFAADTVRAQLFYEGIYRKVTAGAKPARREAVMRRWLARMKRAYKSKVSYEAGFGPAS